MALPAMVISKLILLLTLLISLYMLNDMENLITKQAQYGLDFELIYSIDHNKKENVGKKASVPSPQSFGPSCERTIKLDRIGNFFY